MLQHSALHCLNATEHRGKPLASSSRDDLATIPVVEEQAIVRKRMKLTGGVRVHTVVHHDEVVVDEPLATEQVEVQRVVLDRWVAAPVPSRHEGDTVIVTLHEEVVVVEKRLKATEEIHLIRRQTTRNAPQQMTLRREEAVIEHVDAANGNDERG
jgi:stress response protein YsnF